MEPTPDMLGFAQRFHELSLNRDSADILIKDLLRYGQDMEGLESNLRHDNLKLKHQLHDRNLDYEDAVRSRRDLQQRVQILEAELMTARNGNLKNLNGYVIVLIDGDGLLFKDDFVRQGIAGGKKAAYALRSAILEQCGAHAMGMEVIAKVYVNLAGLCKAMRRDGCLDSETDLKDFTLGFTQAKATFDFIDVGHGKERADNKIKEMTRWHLRNDNCKQVILGISHDAGYAPFLDELFQNDAVRRSVTVLQGVPAVREIASTQVNILDLNDFLFRSEKLVEKVILEPKPIQARTPPLLSPGPIGIKAPVAAVTSVVTSVSSKISSASSPAPLSTPATSAVSTPTPVPSVPTTITYAKAMKKPEPVPPAPVVVLPIQSKPPAPRAAAAAAAPKPPAWNPGPRGLDPPLQVSQAALDNIKKRKDHNKLCNNHYLRGPCAKGDACHFEHKYKPTKEEHVAIAFLTRLNPCSQGQDCDVEDCIYGHHCPSVQNGYCTHPYCKFDKEDHPPGTKFKTYKTHDKSSHDRDRER